MRQIRDDELLYILQDALRALTATQIKAMTDWRPEQQLLGRILAAKVIKRRLDRLEILTDTPEAPPFTYPDLDKLNAGHHADG